MGGMWPGGGIDRGICPDTAVMSGGFCCRESFNKSRTWVKPKTTRNSASADKPRDVFVQIQQGWPKKTRPSPYVILCQIWSFYVKMCRHKYRRTPENCAALQPPCGRDVDDPQLCQSPCVILPNLTVLYVKQYQRYWGDAPEKKWFLASRLSRSLKVIWTDTDRSATYDFLWTFHNNNYEPISYRFLVRRQFQSNIAIFPHPGWRGSPWNWPTTQGFKKVQWWGYRVEKKRLTRSSAIWM